MPRCYLILFAIFLAACSIIETPVSNLSPLNDSLPLTHEYRIRAHDELDVRIWDQEKLSSRVRVRSDLSISLPPLKDFILPQGSDLTTQAHRARVVTRRAERECVVYQNSLNTEIRPHILKLLNRISDYFFVLARSFSTTDSIAKLS